MAKSRAVNDVELNESHYVLKNLSQLIIPLNSIYSCKNINCSNSRNIPYYVIYIGVIALLFF